MGAAGSSVGVGAGSSCSSEEEEEEGRLIVPWISRIARPEWVWRSWGSGLSRGLEDEVVARGWRGMDGIFEERVKEYFISRLGSV